MLREKLAHDISASAAQKMEKLALSRREKALLGLLGGTAIAAPFVGYGAHRLGTEAGYNDAEGLMENVQEAKKWTPYLKGRAESALSLEDFYMDKMLDDPENEHIWSDARDRALRRATKDADRLMLNYYMSENDPRHYAPYRSYQKQIKPGKYWSRHLPDAQPHGGLFGDAVELEDPYR